MTSTNHDSDAITSHPNKNAMKRSLPESQCASKKPKILANTEQKLPSEVISYILIISRSVMAGVTVSKEVSSYFVDRLKKGIWCPSPYSNPTRYRDFILSYDRHVFSVYVSDGKSAICRVYYWRRHRGQDTFSLNRGVQIEVSENHTIRSVSTIPDRTVNYDGLLQNKEYFVDNIEALL